MVSALLPSAPVVEPAAAIQKRSKPTPKASEDVAEQAAKAAKAEEVRAAVEAERARRARAAAAAAAAQPAQPAATGGAETEPSEGEAFVNAIVNRSVLTQPVDLSKEAQPKEAPIKKAKEATAKKSKKAKQVLSSWAEAFIEAMQVLEGSEPDAAVQAQQRLNAVLASASKPGAPRDALPITLRALGYIAASTSHLDRAEAAYLKAMSEAQRRCPDSPVLCGCLRDLAVLSRELTRHTEAMGWWDKAIVAQEAVLKADKKLAADAEPMRLELQLCRADCFRDQVGIACEAASRVPLVPLPSRAQRMLTGHHGPRIAGQV